jgi:hypothetical protein
VIHKLNYSTWSKNELPVERSQSLYLPIRRLTKQTAVTIEAYQFFQLYPTFCYHGYLRMKGKLMGTTSVNLDATGQLLIIYSAFLKHFRKNENTIK